MLYAWGSTCHKYIARAIIARLNVPFEAFLRKVGRNEGRDEGRDEGTNERRTDGRKAGRGEGREEGREG